MTTITPLRRFELRQLAESGRVIELTNATLLALVDQLDQLDRALLCRQDDAARALDRVRELEIELQQLRTRLPALEAAAG